MQFDRGGQAALVTHGRTFTILLSLATRLILVKSRHPNKWAEAKPLQETGNESRYVTVDAYLLWPGANWALSTVYKRCTKRF
ncbi:hypothetical protein BDY19DRAFT_979229 [Irpex rosettiformis]|uniref:Uncharacterized protein n=1 Tax=Irpex rosettiformis TaxID=378272 RepID=A0ACB8TMT6_9APHY|nr:hypothetical protein BDY19DRAFT_979229 [Irpex rosettiformis]